MRFDKYIGKKAKLKGQDDVVTITYVTKDKTSDKALIHVQYDNGIDSVIYPDRIESIIEDLDDVDFSDDDVNIEDPNDVDFDNEIFGDNKKTRHLKESYNVEELINIFNSNSDRVRTMENIADGDEITGVLLDFGGDVEPEVTEPEDFIDAMLSPLRKKLIDKVYSLIEERKVEKKNLKESGSTINYILCDNCGNFSIFTKPHTSHHFQSTKNFEWIRNNDSDGTATYKCNECGNIVKSAIASENEENKNRGGSKMEKNKRTKFSEKSRKFSHRKKINEKRVTSVGFAGETILVNDMVMDISTNRSGHVKEILNNGDVVVDFNGKKETHKFRTVMKI